MVLIILLFTFRSIRFINLQRHLAHISNKGVVCKHHKSPHSQHKTTMDAFIETKTRRMERCKCHSGKPFMCGPCRRLSQKLCRAYHNDDTHTLTPYEELYGRLMFEYVFDIISHEDLVHGTWDSPTLRDQGHTFRIHKLVRKLPNQKFHM